MKKRLAENINLWLFRHLETILHVAGWIWVVVTLAEIWISPNQIKSKITHSYSILSALLVFYSNLLWLVPLFLKRGKWLIYLLLLLVLAGLLLVSGLMIHLGVEGESADDLGLLMGLMILGILFSLIYTFTRDWIINLRFIERLKSEKLDAELAFLKSQVDPHFLFNTLNTLYALALEENSPKTADAIHRLGILMRYNLHDSQSELVSLHKEMDFIEKYIFLQQMRLPAKCRVEWTIKADDESWMEKKIAPMLLIPFVENAFKHGISPTEDSFIQISCSISNDRLVLTVKNSILDNLEKTYSGIGLQNVQNRLKLLYPGQHHLSLDLQQGIHITRLEINLHP
ncbi:MAG: histidine kinase [Bacteroidia bacterium]